MITVRTLEPFPANENPFLHDWYHMGVRLGTNIVVMMENHDNQPCPYLIVVNTETGERTELSFQSEANSSTQLATDQV